MAVGAAFVKIGLEYRAHLRYNECSIKNLSVNMDINLLIQRLRHGENYVVHDALGEPYQENRPPTSLSLKAAEVIMRQSNAINQAAETINNLQRQLNELAEQHELLQKSNATPEPSPAN